MCAIKTEAALCHRTQHALFVRRPSLDAGRPFTVAEIIVTQESIHRVYPPAPSGQPVNDPFAALLRTSGWTRDYFPEFTSGAATAPDGSGPVTP
jgi:hypothetical protein